MGCYHRHIITITIIYYYMPMVATVQTLVDKPGKLLKYTSKV